jgi:DNA polymerase-3 subunit gamma/tau
MDAELCLIRLCQPELQMDAQSLNARLTRMEEQLKSGAFVAAAPAPQPMAVEPEEERPPMPDDSDAPPVMDEPAPQMQAEDTTPVGFWAELVTAIRQEMRPPVVGFFTTGANAPVQGVLCGNQVVLRCNNGFTMEMVSKPQILELVARKASAILGKNVTARAEDMTAKPQTSEKMERLMDFGRAHSNIVNIKDN